MPKGERKKYTKEFKLSAVYLMMSKAYAPKEVLEIIYRVQQYCKLTNEKAEQTPVLKELDQVSLWTKIPVNAPSKPASSSATRISACARRATAPEPNALSCYIVRLTSRSKRRTET